MSKTKCDSAKERKVTHEYFFNINGKRHCVCKDCFSKTPDEKEKFLCSKIQTIF